jgi:hypothetical protein
VETGFDTDYNAWYHDQYAYYGNSHRRLSTTYRVCWPLIDTGKGYVGGSGPGSQFGFHDNPGLGLQVESDS